MKIGLAILLLLLSTQMVLMTAYFAVRFEKRGLADIMGTICFCMTNVFIIALIWRPFHD